MSISRFNLERRKQLRYLREEKLRLQASKEKSQLTKPVVGLGGFGTNKQDAADKHDLEPTRATDHPEMEYAEDPNISLVSEKKEDKESEKKPWEKARDRKKDHQKEIQKKALDEQSALNLGADNSKAKVKWTVYELDQTGEYTEIARGLSVKDAEQMIDQLDAQDGDAGSVYVKQPDSKKRNRGSSNLDKLFEALGIEL